MREENDHRGRVDGLTSRQELGIVRRLMKDKRWNTDQNGIRQKCVDLVERVIDDRDLHPVLHLKAIDLVLKMEAQNIVDERIFDGDGAGMNEGPQVILVLPLNGSEIEIGNGEQNEITDDEDQGIDVDEMGEELAGEGVPGDAEDD